MNIEEKYPLLIGHSDQGSQELRSIQEVADFICSQGLESDLLITQEDGSYFLNTFGIYIDRIADMEYREALLKALIPMQMELDLSLIHIYQRVFKGMPASVPLVCQPGVPAEAPADFVELGKVHRLRRL